MSSLAQQFLEVGVGRTKAKTQLGATPDELKLAEAKLRAA